MGGVDDVVSGCGGVLEGVRICLSEIVFHYLAPQGWSKILLGGSKRTSFLLLFVLQCHFPFSEQC